MTYEVDFMFSNVFIMYCATCSIHMCEIYVSKVYVLSMCERDRSVVARMKHLYHKIIIENIQLEDIDNAFPISPRGLLSYVAIALSSPKPLALKT